MTRLSRVLFVLVALLIAGVTTEGRAAPQPTYPFATLPFSPTADYVTGVQAGSTKNFKLGDIQSSSATTTTTGPYSGQVAQNLSGAAPSGCLSIFSYLTAAQQAAVQAGTSVVDFQPIAVAAETALATNVTTFYNGSNCLFWPAGTYNFGSTWNLKHTLRIVGAGTGYAGGYATLWQFPLDTTGVIVNRYNTFANTTISPTTTGADGTTFDGIAITSAGGTDTTAHGIWMRARAVFTNGLISSFPGNQMNIAATAGGGPTLEGNANGWVVTNTRLIGGLDGLAIFGADVNAGYDLGLDISNCRSYGLRDSSFLGATHLQPEIATCGSSSQVSYGGNRYYLNHTATGVQGAATTPGTDATVWVLYGSGGVAATYPAWSSSGVYVNGGSLRIDNANARSVVIGFYAEGGQPRAYVLTPSFVFGGLHDPLDGNSTGADLQNNGGTLNNPAGGFAQSGTAPNGDATNVQLGSRYASADPSGLMLTMNDATVSPSSIMASWQFCGNDLIETYARNCGLEYLVRTGPNTSINFGAAAGVGRVVAAAQFALADIAAGSVSSSARRMWVSSASPTSTGHGVGEVAFNNVVAPGLPWGWMETTRGSPDTWTVMGRLPYADTTVSGLASCTSTNKGSRTNVTDASSATYSVGASVTGGGSAYIPMICNGSAWVAGKNDRADPRDASHLLAANDNVGLKAAA